MGNHEPSKFTNASALLYSKIRNIGKSRKSLIKLNKSHTSHSFFFGNTDQLFEHSSDLKKKIFRFIDKSSIAKFFWQHFKKRVWSIYSNTLLSDSSKILNNEQIYNGITLESKPIMQKTLYFLKNEMDNNIHINCYKAL